MFYLLFTFYLVLFCWIITRLKFFKESRLERRILMVLFLIRVLVGLINGYINMYYYPVSDSVSFHHSREFRNTIFYSKIHMNILPIFSILLATIMEDFLESSNSYWNDTRSKLIVKMLSIFNIFSRTNFFINSLFYNFLIFFGIVALYRVFIKILPSYRIVLIVCIFLLPSVIFFSSAIHRDGLILLSLSMIIYHLFFMMKNKRYSIKNILITLVFLGLILLLRNFVFLILVPALLAWIVAEQNPKYPFIVFTLIYLFISILFFCTEFLPPAFNLPAHVASRQSRFYCYSKTRRFRNKY